MGKASRNQQRRNVTTSSAAPRVFPNFPYDKAFTRDELAEILERAKIIGRAMRYGQGPNGAILALPPDLFELWMVHAALAGVTVDEDLAFIRPRVIPDVLGDAVEWVLKKEDTAAAREADLAREAAARAAEIEALDPRVRDAVLDMFVKKSERATARNSPSNVDESQALSAVEEAARAAEIAKQEGDR